MERKEFKFRRVVSWSDHPDGGESVDGRIPVAAWLPDGRRVDLSDRAVMSARWHRSVFDMTKWVVLAENNEEGEPALSEKSRSGGDDASRRSGRYCTTVWVLAPADTKFEFPKKE